MFNKIVLFTSLMVVWVIFSGFLNSFFIGCGVASCAIALYYAVKMDAVSKAKFPLYLKPKIFFYYIWLCKEVFVSSIVVACKMWQPKPDISPTMAWVKTSQETSVGITTYANSITLTPGTVCIEVDGGDMCIHALTQGGLEDVASGDMDERVKQAVS